MTSLPDELCLRLLRGASPITVWREFRGMSRAELAAATGLDRPLIRELETGKRPLSIGRREAIARELGVDAAALLPDNAFIGCGGRLPDEVEEAALVEAGEARKHRRRVQVRKAKNRGSERVAKLPRYTLAKNKQADRWDLTRDSDKQLVKSFEKKQNATKGGALRKAIGGEGSVVIKNKHGRIQQERTFPRSRDPKKSPG